MGPLTDAAAAWTDCMRPAKTRLRLLAVTSQVASCCVRAPKQHSQNLEGLSERQRALDVVQLHKLVLEEALGMSEEDIRDQKHLKYVRDAHEAIDEVRNGANVAFLMNPVRMEQVRDIAFAGEVLPQKSTDFYPKLLSGLTIYSLEEAAQGSAVRRALGCGFPAADRGSVRPIVAGLALLFAALLARARHRSCAVAGKISSPSTPRRRSIPFPCST